MRLAKEESGQQLLTMAILLITLIAFVGLAVNGGMAFITKARLSKSVDAACLAGMRALPQGQTVATSLATHIFNANYGANPPTPSITFPVDGYGDKQVQVSASTPVPNFFAPHMFPVWNVADTGVATRGKLVMELVLDRSGSMQNNDGWSALKAAVPSFVDDFDNTQDSVGMISFASNATIDFSINTNFQTPINNVVNGWTQSTFSGGTFGTGGTYVASDGPPLAMADHQIGTVPILTGQNVTRVAVYFTDGLMNTIQDNFTCYTSSTAHATYMLNYGGYDTGTNEVDVFDPLKGTDLCPYEGYGQCLNPSQGYSVSNIVYSSAEKVCQNPWGTYVTKFPSQQLGQTTINRANVTTEAQYRALQTANTMRNETPGVYIFVIGLGSQISGSTSTQAFLKNLANDPTSSSYNANLPVGQLFIVPDCPSSTCTQELNTAFQTIAAKILLRLTQ